MKLPRRFFDTYWDVTLLAFALAHVGGVLGAVFSWLPQGSTEYYNLAGLVLALEVLVLVGSALYRLWPHRASPSSGPLLEAEP